MMRRSPSASMPWTPRPKRRRFNKKLGLTTVDASALSQAIDALAKQFSFQKLSGMFLVLAVVLSINSLYVSLTLSPFPAEITLSNSLGFSASAERCVVVAMMSHADESDIRDFHRNQFKQYQSKLPYEEMSKNAIHLMFGVVDGDQPGTFLRQNPSDVIQLQTRSKIAHRDFTAEQNYEMLERIEPTLRTACKDAFVLRADTSYLINYRAVLNMINHVWMPMNSTYFGSLVTNFPTPHASLATSFKERTKEINHFPLFAYGGVYGLSRDMLRKAVASKSRVLDGVEDDFQIPSQDRALGVAMDRARVQIHNPVYVNGIHHLCSMDNLLETCDAYSKYFAFGVPDAEAGLSVKRMQTASEELQMCVLLQKNIDGTVVNNRFYRIQQHGYNSDTTSLLTQRCTLLSSRGKHLLHQLEGMRGSSNYTKSLLEQLEDDSSSTLDMTLSNVTDIHDEVHKIASSIMRN